MPRTPARLVEAGEFIIAKVDVVMGNDGSTAVALPVWRQIGAARVFDPDRVAIVFAGGLVAYTPQRLGLD